jgi:hypothetical protein
MHARKVVVDASYLSYFEFVTIAVVQSVPGRHGYYLFGSFKTMGREVGEEEARLGSVFSRTTEQV